MTSCTGSTRLPFGKYKGRKLSDPRIPSAYLRNLYASDLDHEEEHDQGWLWSDLRKSLRAEVIKRGMPFGKFLGVALDDLPGDYLTWLTTIELLPPLDSLVREVIAQRDRERERNFRLAMTGHKAKKPKRKKPKRKKT